MKLTPAVKKEIRDLLNKIYGRERSSEIIPRLEGLIKRYWRLKQYREQSDKCPGRPAFSQRDVVLITYGDSIYDPTGERPSLEVLQQFLVEHFRDAVSTVHLLPFYPYSSDDGFSVIDYKRVNESMGSWKDIRAIKKDFALACDLVANHISAESSWFQGYLQGDSDYQDFFIAVDKNTDLSAVTRARAHPLLTPFDRKGKTIYLWTTFSADQIDLNYQNPEVLLKIIDILLFYASQGADIIRLDAVAHIWKEIGTSCINLDKTHLLIRLFRSLLDETYPGTALLTETNVPHQENISYFGSGKNEAQLVYQFALMGLVVYTYLSGRATRLLEWLESLEPLPAGCTFFNVLATHDGIGVMPVKGVLSVEEVELLIEGVKQRGGLVSCKETREGIQPYELNITYYSAVAGEEKDTDLAVKKYLSSQVVLLSVTGIPAIYIHSLLGTENYLAGVKETGFKRTINRRKYTTGELAGLLSNSFTRESRILSGYLDLIKLRKEEEAFHPEGSQEVVFIREEIFSLLRTSPDGKERILVLVNVTGQEIQVELEKTGLNYRGGVKDIISSNEYLSGDVILMTPYRALWLKEES